MANRRYPGYPEDQKKGLLTCAMLVEEPPIPLDQEDWQTWQRDLTDVEKQIIFAFQHTLDRALAGKALIYHIVQPIASEQQRWGWADYAGNLISDIEKHQTEAENALPFIEFEMRLNKDTQTLRPFILGQGRHAGRDDLCLSHTLHKAPDKGQFIMQQLRENLPREVVVEWNGDSNKAIVIRAKNARQHAVQRN